MSDFPPEFWMTMLVYAVTFGTVYGQIRTQIKNLEKKVEKHNSVIKRNYDRKLWSKRMVALAVQKGVITPEQYKEITGEAYEA